MNGCPDVAGIGKRVTRDHQHLAERSRSNDASPHSDIVLRILVPRSPRSREPVTLGRSVAQPELREVAGVSQPGCKRACESGLASSWGTDSSIIMPAPADRAEMRRQILFDRGDTSATPARRPRRRRGPRRILSSLQGRDALRMTSGSISALRRSRALPPA